MTDPFLSTDSPSRYPVTIQQVREVMVVGRADLAYWRERLEPEALWLRVVDGQAELAITATSAVWFGFPFRELTVSVSISRSPDGHTHDGFFLVQAYNNKSSFAWVERTMFKTPYDSGGIDLTTGSACGLALRRGDARILALRRGARQAMGPELELDWEGPIIVPGRTERKPGQFFRARLAGRGRQATFVPGEDTWFVEADGADSVVRQLSESCFTPQLWQVREAAIHARTSSFDRNRILSGQGALEPTG